MGLPILLAAPDWEASGIVLCDGAGLHLPAENPEALAAAVMTLMADGALRQGLAEKSLAAAPSHSREEQARQMLAVFELAASGRGSEAGR